MGRPDSAVDSMLRALGRFAVLPLEQQMEAARLVRRWQDWPGGRDAAPPGVRRSAQRARRRLIETNLRLVVAIARKFMGRGMPLEDLVQEGTIGLDRAVDLYDPSRGYAFTTYAYWWIRQAINRALIADQTVRVPSNSVEDVWRLRRWTAEFEEQYGRRPTRAEIEEQPGMGAGKVDRLMDASRAMGVTSLDVPVGEEENLTLMDCAGDGMTAELQLGALDDRIQSERITRALRCLTEQDQALVQARFVDGLKWEDAAQLCGFPSSAEARQRLLKIRTTITIQLRRMERGLVPQQQVRPPAQQLGTVEQGQLWPVQEEELRQPPMPEIQLGGDPAVNGP